MCFKKGCIDYRKSIARDKLEAEFETLLSSVTPAAPLLQMAQIMFRNLWNDQAHVQQHTQTTLESELSATQKRLRVY